MQTFPHISSCEDFDRYCKPIPPYPYTCDGSGGSDVLALTDVWIPNPPSNICGVEIRLSDTWFTSPPWTAAMTCQDWDTLGFASRDIPGGIRAAFGEAYSTVMGTDLNPLILEFVLNGEGWSKCLFANAYLELGNGPASAPTDYVWSPNCSTCGGPSRRFPMICQQATPPAGCGPIETAPHKPSIAVGFLSYLDDDSCHCSDPSDPWHSPRNEHLSFFDGHKWWKLRQGLFPDGSGDFRVRDDENIIKLTIRACTIKVELTCTDPQPDEYSWCEIPRDYLGSFNTMTVGYKHSCRLNGSGVPGSEWDCQNTPSCVYGAERAYVPRFDNIILHGGMGAGSKGVCCYPDLSCSEEYYLDCESLGGVFQGHDTTCAELACAPPFKPDRDMDGDVDLKDFGWFQNCLSGSQVQPSMECRIADLDDDHDVDEFDLTAFIACVSGSDTPYDVSCMP